MRPGWFILVLLAIATLRIPGVQPERQRIVVGTGLISPVYATVDYEEWVSRRGSPRTLNARFQIGIGGYFVLTVRPEPGADEWNPTPYTRKVEFLNGDRIWIHDRLRTYTAVRTSDLMAFWYPYATSRDQDCSRGIFKAIHGPKETAGFYQCRPAEERLLGFRLAMESRQADGQWIQSWRSPDLYCVELRRLTTTLDPAGHAVETRELRAVRARKRAPDQELLKVPRYYEHVSLSEQLRRAGRRAGRFPTLEELAPLRPIDEQWETGRITHLSEAGKLPFRRAAARRPSPPQ
jgi:hypothetical protein